MWSQVGLGSITMNKASWDDGIPVELFQILKDDAMRVLHSTCQQIWKTQQWPQAWKMSVFILISKKGNAKEWSNYCTVALISQASKVMLKILQTSERLLLNHAKMPGFLAPRGEDFNPGPEMRLDRSELLCNKVLLKYKGGRESFWHRHQKGAERVPPC